MARRKKRFTETEYIEKLASEYESMKNDRQPYLDKAREAAKYTLPSLLKDDNGDVMVYETPNQSIGADGVNNLASKVTLTMLPPNQPFFKFSMDSNDLKELAINGGQDPKQYEDDVVKGLSLTEKLLVDYNEKNGDRVCLGEANKHLYVAGNVMLIHRPDTGLKYYPLNRYVVKRDYCGNVLKAITTETIGYYALPEDMQAEVLLRLKLKEKTDEIKDLDEKELDLYTVYKREKKHWVTYQEVEGVEVPRSRGKYPLEICPFMALRYTRIDGESYGRGLVEEYIGDISYLDVLSRAIRESSLAASKLVMLVNPNGITKIQQLANTRNGGYCRGKAEDVTPLQANKYYDLQVARAEKESIEKRLYRVFLLAQAVQRDSERTTATEIQYMIRDLEEALGNHYSIMSKEFQTAYVKISFYHLRKVKKNALPDLITDDKVHLIVTTGLEALGRGSDLNKLNVFANTMMQFAQFAQVCGAKTDKIAKMVAASLNIDVEDLFYTEEEKQQQAQQLQQAQLAQRVAPNVVNKAAEMEMQNQKQGQQM